MEEEIEQGKKSGLVHLSYYNLQSIPESVFDLSKLYRLDLGWNQLQVVPDAIGVLHHLEYLWLNNNPLMAMSPNIAQCQELKLLDIQCTPLKTLPHELGRIARLENIDLGPKSCLAPAFGRTTGSILSHLRHQDLRKHLMKDLYDKLREESYRELTSTKAGNAEIQKVVQQVFHAFTELNEIKGLIRHAARLFPISIDQVEVEAIREKYLSLKRENEMKKMGAELQIKIRNIYFDRIDPSIVEGLVKVRASKSLTDTLPILTVTLSLTILV